jgi:plasmid stabilization system protein ParE
MRVQFTANASRQARAIFNYIAADNPDAAQRALDRILTLCNGLADQPYAGRKISHGRMRRLTVTPYPYLIYYEVSGQTVRIIRIRHSARFRRAFQEPQQAFAR